MRFDIDLDFSLKLPRSGDDAGSVVNGKITAAGREIHVQTDSAAAFGLGSRAALPAVRSLAQLLARQGVVVSFGVPEGTIVSLGAVEASTLQRMVTGSAHIKPGKSNTWSALLKAQKGNGSKASLLPPPTPLPLSPTFQRRYRMKPTTTHYSRGGGRPRLIFVRDSQVWDGQPPREFNLLAGTTVIGGGTESDLVLPGLAAAHARVVHSDDDEYVFIPGPPSQPEQTGRARILRTGARLVLGDWRLVFFREEYADHGRPYGGRTAGEFSRQRPQMDPRSGLVEYDAVYGVGDPRQP